MANEPLNPTDDAQTPDAKAAFQSACKHVMPFGKHQGKTLDRIAVDNEGLRYLDWLSDQELYEPLATHLENYINHPSIAREIERACDR